MIHELLVVAGVLGSMAVGAAVGGAIGVFTQKGADDLGIETTFRLVQGGIIGGVAGTIAGVLVFI